jgi:nicotinamidase-related amidase
MLLDIETQQDFFDPDGSCYSAQSEKARANILRLFEWARTDEIPVISTVLRVRAGERGPLAAAPHCIDGSEGEQKLPGTLLRSRINFGLRNVTDLPEDVFKHFQQVIFEKRDTDIFAHARLERLITELPHVTFIICGAGVAKGIVQAAVGLRTREFGVIFADDAAVDLNDPLAEMARLRMEAKGVVFAPTSQIVSLHPARRRLHKGVLRTTGAPQSVRK